MAHVFWWFAPADALFANQMAMQLMQRGIIVFPAPDPILPEHVHCDSSEAALADASHILIVAPAAEHLTDAMQEEWERMLARPAYTLVVLHHSDELPSLLWPLPVVDFREQFLLACEKLVAQLLKTGAAIRQLTVENPPPVAKPDLLPHSLSSERCWRADRLRINYLLPMVLSYEMLVLRMPSFLEAADFEPIVSNHPRIEARRQRVFGLFDPRRADHTLAIEPLEGEVRLRYQMTRSQVYYWWPAHYHVLDREAAALFRYLATGELHNSLNSVRSQARVAQAVSWATVSGLVLLLALLLYLLFG